MTKDTLLYQSKLSLPQFLVVTKASATGLNILTSDGRPTLMVRKKVDRFWELVRIVKERQKDVMMGKW